MTSISKTVAVLIILLLASSFVLGNVFADYKAEKMAKKYKATTEKQLIIIQDQNELLMKAQGMALMKSALEQGIPLNKVEPLIEQNGLYLLQLDSANNQGMDDIDEEYLMWINSLRKPERRIFHFHTHGY